MFLPLGDAPNPRGTPHVNYALIAVNVAVFLLVTLPLSGAAPDPGDPLLPAYLEMLRERFGAAVPLRQLAASISAYDLFVFRHGFRPAEPSLADLATSMFLHGSFLHLAGNMLFLWIYGDNVEQRLGRLGYLAAYLATGAFATLAHAAFARGSDVPMVGASGAISGALGFYFVFFPRNQVRLLVALFPFLVDVVVVPARVVLGFYLLLDNVLPLLLSRGGGGGVAHGAHIGGFLAGLGIAAWIRRREAAPPADLGRPAPGAREEAPDARLVALLEAGRPAEAAELYFSLDELEERALPPAACLELGEWLTAAGHPRAALAVLRALLRRLPRGPLAARAHLDLGRLQLEVLRRPTSAWQHFLEALESDPHGPHSQEARSALRAVEALQKGPWTGRR